MKFEFSKSMVQAKLIRRYKRFLADVELDDGSTITVYCPNTGAMTGCVQSGWRVWLSKSDSLKRKYAYTLELVETDFGLTCIHSSLANKVVGLALANHEVKELQGYSKIQAEVRYGKQNSRADFLLSTDMEKCFVEVKSVTFLREDGRGVFPDTITRRGSKHLRELIVSKADGFRAVLFFCVLHAGIDRVSVADDIDPIYAQILSEAVMVGVEVLAYSCTIDSDGIELSGRINFEE